MTKRKKRVEQEAEVVVIPVDFREVLPQILARVNDVTDLESWKAAFPQIEFMEVDEGLTGKRIDWENRSSVEKAAYVAYMADPQLVIINFEVDIDGYEVDVRIDDSERAWYLWFYGCFDCFDKSKEGWLSDEARGALLGYAAQQAGGFEEMVMDKYSANNVYLVSFEMRAAPDCLGRTELDKRESFNE